MKKQAGFSLVELVIVIIVVGLLAVAALPRFINVTDEAKKASIEGVAGGFATAVLSARAQWEAYGRPTDNNDKNLVNYDGTPFYLSNANTNGTIRDGYPLYVTSSGRTAANVNATDCLELIGNLLQNPPAATAVDADAKNGKNLFFVKAATESNERVCRYYQLASADQNGSTNNITSGHSFSYKPAKGQVEVHLVN